MPAVIPRRAALVVIAAAGAAVAGVDAMLRFVPPSHLKRSELVIAPGDLPPPGAAALMADLDAGLVAAVSATRPGEYIAFRPRCTHLHCGIVWKANGPPIPGYPAYYECPCHQSRFSLDGRRVYGPAPRDLDRYESRFDERGSLVVDTAAVIRGAIGEGVEYPAQE